MTIGQLIKSLKPKRTEHWIMISILLYTISSVLGGFVSPFISKIFLYSGCVIYIFILVTRWKGIPLKGVNWLVYFLLVVWTLCLTFHMIFLFDLSSVLSGETNRGLISIISFVFDSLPFFPHLLPLCICCFSKHYEVDMRYFVRMLTMVAIIYLLIFPFAFSNMINVDYRNLDNYVNGVEASKYTTLGIRYLLPATIMIYLKKYIPNNNWWLFMITFIGGLVVNAYMARRGSTATSVLYLGVLWLVYTINDKGARNYSTFFAGIIMFAAGYLIFSDLSDSFFSYIIERGFENTRVTVNDSFIADVFSGDDWIYGRGWFGQYFDDIYGFRNTIETGYFALILRGGIIYLIPYLIVLLSTFINGVFRSNNIMCKSFGVMAGMQFIELYPWGWPTFNFNYMAIWLGVFICNQARYRNLNDYRIKELYF